MKNLCALFRTNLLLFDKKKKGESKHANLKLRVYHQQSRHKKMSRKYQERDKPTFQLADFIVDSSQKQGSKSKPKSQEVCSFFAQGRFCKYGNDCKFLHANPSEAKSDVNDNNNKKSTVVSSLQIKPSLPRERGRVFILNDEKGYGFVIPSTGGKKLWFHYR